MTDCLELKNGQAALFDELPVLAEAEFRTFLTARVEAGCRVLSFFALPEQAGTHRLIAVLCDPASRRLLLNSCGVKERYSSLTPEIPALHLFEREIAEDDPIVPVGHPGLHPVRRYPEGQPGVRPFRAMRGEAAHEVAVGPIHAGVIEPGHFRFQCMGEDVYALEIALGYQHRGIAGLLRGGPDALTLRRIETAAGDSSVAAAVAGCALLETLTDRTVPQEVCVIRAVALELERIANHIGDLGALAGDVAFLPTASFCGRIRGEYLNMTAELCGNRFGRGLVIPGSCRYPLEKERGEKLRKWIGRVYPDLLQALQLMFDAPSVLDRLENTGTVTRETARALGLVGPAGRASGLTPDARRDLPREGYRAPEPVDTEDLGGDVLARGKIRYREIRSSHDFLMPLLADLPGDLAVPPAAPAAELAPNRIAVAVTEAWRGELCHTAVTDDRGRLRKYQIVDPSFHNWSGLAMALRGEQISNFPICNKSFNLSYCGHDL